MALYLFKRSVSFVNAYPVHARTRFDPRRIEAGAVCEEPPLFGCGVRPEDVERLPDPRDDRQPTAIAEVVSECDALLAWVSAAYLPEPCRVVAGRIHQLWDAAVMLLDAPPMPFDAEVIRAARSVPDLVQLVKRLRQWATNAAATSGAVPPEASRLEAATSSDPSLLPNGAKVNPEDVPAELRDLGRSGGPILTATYLAMTLRWNISSVELTKAFQSAELTYRLKVGRTYAYRYTELCRLLDRRAARNDDA
jgi:hypothetical protein